MKNTHFLFLLFFSINVQKAYPTIKKQWRKKSCTYYQKLPKIIIDQIDYQQDITLKSITNLHLAVGAIVCYNLINAQVANSLIAVN